LALASAALASATSIGCLEDPEGGGEAAGEAVSGLASEQTINANQRIVHAAGLYYTSPDVAVNQYASASLGGYCNGVMIGPNTFLSAAHCGGGPTWISFRTYRGGSTAVSDVETFSCDAMVQTFNDTDAVLFYCAPNGGVSPGDKYGYVDFDLTAPVAGQQIYSISANNLLNGSLPYDTRMYANGQVTSPAGVGHWFTPASAPNTGVEMNLWGEGGMSGSPHFNAANHRLTIAPLSTAPGGGGWNRNALSMGNLLYWGVINAAYDPAAQGPTVNLALVRSLGLVAESYYGWADKELDGLFDIQRDLERLRGEGARDWYFLGFDSPRRNALWTPQLATFDAAARSARILRTSGAGYADALLHERLSLGAGTYRITFSTLTQASQYASSLYVGLKGPSGYVGEYVPTAVGAGWQLHTVEVTAPAAGMALVLGLAGTADVLVSAVSVVQAGAVMDFDRFDKRTNWRNDIDGSRAMVVPDGRTTGTPNWAVRVSAPATTGFPVRNRQLALNAGRPYRVCFDARRESAAGFAQVHLRVMSGGAVATSTTVYAGSTWGTHCTAAFTPITDDNNLQLRLMAGDSAFVVDNIAITAL
jgi:hypothetical protein